eukprot:IDg18455t1
MRSGLMDEQCARIISRFFEKVSGAPTVSALADTASALVGVSNAAVRGALEHGAAALIRQLRERGRNEALRACTDDAREVLRALMETYRQDFEYGRSSVNDEDVRLEVHVRQMIGCAFADAERLQMRNAMSTSSCGGPQALTDVGYSPLYASVFYPSAVLNTADRIRHSCTSHPPLTSSTDSVAATRGFKYVPSAAHVLAACPSRIFISCKNALCARVQRRSCVTLHIQGAATTIAARR